MNAARGPRLLGAMGVLGAVALGTVHARESGALRWRTAENTADARIESWALARLLEEISAETGWEIYVEPGTRRTVTARFEKLGTAEALRRLLDGLNFALLPQVVGPPKLFVYESSVEHATEPIRARRAAAGGKREPIADERIVVMKHGSADAIARLAKRLGATIVARVDGLGAFRLRFESGDSAADADAALARDRDVESVELNYSITPPATLQPLDEGGPPSPSRLTPDISPSAERVIVGLVDTAVQGEGRLREFLQPGVSVEGDYQPPREPLLHGTAMAETILDGVARALAEHGDTSGKVALSILPIDVYGAHEATNTFSVVQGLTEALDRRANVINLSLGGDTDSRLLRELIEAAVRRGVVVVAAAGNRPVATPTYPAADPGVISVTASDGGGRLAPYANTGRWVDAMAPGDTVLDYLARTWHGTGTSFATSRVSGWTAGYLASPGAIRSAATRETLTRWGPSRSAR